MRAEHLKVAQYVQFEQDGRTAFGFVKYVSGGGAASVAILDETRCRATGDTAKLGPDCDVTILPPPDKRDVVARQRDGLLAACKELAAGCESVSLDMLNTKVFPNARDFLAELAAKARSAIAKAESNT